MSVRPGGSVRPTPWTNINVNLSAMFVDVIDEDKWTELKNYSKHSLKDIFVSFWRYAALTFQYSIYSVYYYHLSIFNYLSIHVSNLFCPFSDFIYKIKIWSSRGQRERIIFQLQRIVYINIYFPWLETRITALKIGCILYWIKLFERRDGI